MLILWLRPGLAALEGLAERAALVAPVDLAVLEATAVEGRMAATAVMAAQAARGKVDRAVKVERADHR